jgi:predicted O-methyltransferase YrrM
MANSLASPELAPLLQRLFAEADARDPVALARIKAEADSKHGGRRYEAALMPLYDDVYIPISPATGRLFYLLVRMLKPKRIVEFGMSMGISALHFAAALKDNGSGTLISTELSANKAARARAHLDEAGLAGFVEIRQGDAFETLKGLDGDIDLLFLDGWKDLYLPMLRFLEPRLRPGALVIADDLHLFPDRLASYAAYVRDEKNGYVSVDFPVDDGTELSLRV